MNSAPCLCPRLLLLSIALSLPCLHAAPGDVWLEAPPTVTPGSSFTVDLHVDMAAESYGAGQFQITWDPALLEVDLAHGASGVAGGPGTGGALPPTAVNPLNPGSLIFNSLTITPGIAGDVVLHTVGFNVLGAAGSLAALTLVVENLARLDGMEFPIGSAFPRPGGGATVQISATPVATGVCGDIDDDSDVDILDSFLAAQVALAIIVVDSQAMARADVDSDGGVDIIDALLISMSVVGLPTTLHCPLGGTPEPPPVVDPLLAVGDFDLVHYLHANSNGELFVEVVMNAGTQILGAYDVTLSFDPAVLQAAEVLPSSTSIGAPLAINIDNPSGQVTFNDFNLGGIDCTGVFDVATVRFLVVGLPGTSSPMDGFVNTLGDGQFQDIGAPAPRAMVSGTGQVLVD